MSVKMTAIVQCSRIDSHALAGLELEHSRMLHILRTCIASGTNPRLYRPSLQTLFDRSLPYYVYVTTWSTVDYTSVTSIMHCRPCCNKLIS